MATDVQIISDAYVLLGKKPVSSPLTDNPQYSAAKDIYDRLLPAVLSMHTWRFASKSFQLSESTETSPFERWSKVFLMPAEQLVSYRTEPIAEFEIYENKLYTNETAIRLDFVFKASEANFPPYFTRLMTFQLAADIAMTVTQTLTIAQYWDQKAARELNNARYLDSTIQPNPVVVRDAIWESHFGTGMSNVTRFI
jgi:hypothetical protein